MRDDIRKMNFDILISLYYGLGLFLINFFVFIANFYTNDLSGFKLPYLFWAPSILTGLLGFFLINNRSYFSKLKIIVILGLLGIFHALITQLFFITLSVIITIGSIFISCGVMAIILFDKLRNIDQEIDLLVKKKISDNKFEKCISILHDDIKFWMDIFIKIFYWSTFALVTGISILFGLMSQNLEEEIFPSMELLYSIFGIFMFIYFIGGIFVWIFYPLYTQSNRIRKILLMRLK